MGKKSTPDAPDYGPMIAASKEMAETNWKISQEQLQWAREQDTMNRATLDRVLGVQLPIMEQQYKNALADRQRYESVFLPAEDALIKEFQEYGGPEERMKQRGMAMGDVATSFDAARKNALSRLESFGVDPSQTRNAALDIGVRLNQAASQAAAATAADQRVTDTSRALRADVINIGRGMPSQIAQSYGQAVAAGQAGVGGANSTTGTSANALQSGLGFSGQAMQGYQNAGNFMNQGFQNAMQSQQMRNDQSGAMWSAIGGLAGTAAMFMNEGGSVRRALPMTHDGMVNHGPTDGTGIDDQVPARLSVGEYVIPADVVAVKGKEFFDRLLQKHHTPVHQQRRALMMGA